MTDADGFWAGLAELVSRHRLVIDRPKGSPHPRYPTSVYPLDYGHLHGTASNDGDGIDVWVGSLGERKVTGVVCAVDLAHREAELKSLLGCTSAEAQVACNIHNVGSQSAILLNASIPGVPSRRESRTVR